VVNQRRVTCRQPERLGKIQEKIEKIEKKRKLKGKLNDAADYSGKERDFQLWAMFSLTHFSSFQRSSIST